MSPGPPAASPLANGRRNAQVAQHLHRRHRSGCDAVLPRTLNELSNEGIEALIGLVMLLEANYERPNLCNRIACIAKAAGGVRSIDTLFAVVRVQCKLRRIEARLWEAFNREGFVWPTTVCGAERCECRRLGVGHGGWACSGILHDLPQAFDRRRSAHKVPALVAALEWQVSSCEPNEGVRSPPGSSSCYWWNRCERCALHIPQCKSGWSSTTCHSRISATTSAWRRSLKSRASAWPPSSRRQTKQPQSSAARCPCEQVCRCA